MNTMLKEKTQSWTIATNINLFRRLRSNTSLRIEWPLLLN